VAASSTIWGASRRRNVEVWACEIGGAGLDAILITASGCGTTVKDYGYMLRTDPAHADAAARISRLAMDICEYLSRLELAARTDLAPLVVAYHAACSLQHGKKVVREPKRLRARKVGNIEKLAP
jgi:glycolate oxidase iron-sulfur subunit